MKHRWRLAAMLVASLALHGVAVRGLLASWPGTPATPAAVVVELTGVGQPFTSRSGADGPGPVGSAASPEGVTPTVTGDPASARDTGDDRVAALVAERDDLAARLADAEAEQARRGDEVTALTARTAELAQELARQQAHGAELEAAIREQQAAAEERMRQLRQTHEALVAALREELAGKDIALRRAGAGLTVSIVDRVLFPSGQAELTPEGLAVIDKVATALAEAAPRHIVVEGHTDNVPIGAELRARFPTNRELSTARAAEVVRRLVERGMPPGALEAVGRADTQPVASNDTETGRRRNRRIEITLSDTDAPPADTGPDV